MSFRETMIKELLEKEEFTVSYVGGEAPYLARSRTYDIEMYSYSRHSALAKLFIEYLKELSREESPSKG